MFFIYNKKVFFNKLEEAIISDDKMTDIHTAAATLLIFLFVKFLIENENQFGSFFTRLFTVLGYCTFTIVVCLSF